jgi:membrane protease YdiL (CAAX protease family)
MRVGRLVALFEILLCSDFPTQLAIGATLSVLGISPTTPQGNLSVRYVVTLSLVDTAVLMSLIVFLLKSHGERPREILLGSRPIAGELKLGLPMTLAVFAIAIAVLGAVQLLAPSLHNISQNPLQDMVRRPQDVWLFALVVVIAGGVREEIQRAFILHRFEVWLGGAEVGVVVSSLAFGIGHRLQGNDVALATGLMGLFWGIVYLRRRSAVAPIVSHSGFNLLELAQYFALGR